MPLKLPLDNCGYEVKGSPLLKWPGGKRSLLKYILPLLPENFNSYYETFVGGGALYFALQPEKACLSDCNSDLINCYSQVRDEPSEVIAHLRNYKNTEESYYEVRSEVPEKDAAKAARLIYLTTLSFNGIYRINSSGKFNVPYGQRPHLKPLNVEKIKVIKAVREVIPALGLKEAKDLVDAASGPLKEGVVKEEAATMKEKLEAAGAVIETK